jgi:hypothetical protein
METIFTSGKSIQECGNNFNEFRTPNKTIGNMMLIIKNVGLLLNVMETCKEFQLFLTYRLNIYNNGDEKPVTRFWITLMKCCNICCFSIKLDTNNKIHVTENKSNASDAGKTDSAVTWKDVGYGTLLSNIKEILL